MADLYIGLMSGTSLDGVDAVLVDFDGERPQVISHGAQAFSAELKAELLALNSSGADELHRAALASNALVSAYAQQVNAILAQSGVSAKSIKAVGAHGQTVRHRPQEFDGTGYTLQLNQPSLLAELCGIDVVADFRSRDVAAGGQGAPLVPPFHRAFFGKVDQTVCVINIGGISNISILDPQSNDLVGYDCGPGNALIDTWCLSHTGKPYDDAGQWAAKGKVNATLLAHMQQEPYFAKPAPKSTGRDLFNQAWLDAQLAANAGLKPITVQATLTELTAWACANSVRASSPECTSLVVCGGGALNRELMRRIQAALPDCTVESSEIWGLPPLQVEATAFAWLARQTVNRQTSSLPSVTGARGARILGAIYPA